MARTRIVETVTAAALIGCLAACGSAKSTAAAPAASASTVSTVPATTDVTSAVPSSQTPATSASTSAPAPTTSQPRTIAAVLAAWGTGGKISTKAMPKADPAWVARIKPMAEVGANPQNHTNDTTINANDLNLIALVDEAAREHDVASLTRLRNGGKIDPTLNQPGALDALAAILEKTHAVGQNGYTYPGFAMTHGAGIGSAEVAIEKTDAAALGLSSPTDYKGGQTYFDGNWSGAGADGTLTWG